MKNLILLILFLPLTVFATPQEKYADDVEKAKIDYRRALKECRAMPPYDRAACQKRVEQTWQDVQKGLKAQHLSGKK